MVNSFTSQTEAEQHGLPAGPRYWLGFRMAADLPFDRGGLGAGGLSSSAEDMTRYLSIHVNEGRYGATALVSPAGAAELQRAAVPTGMAGVSYAMGWEVRRADGVPKVSHDGSTFNTHANAILLPDRYAAHARNETSLLSFLKTSHALKLSSGCGGGRGVGVGEGCVLVVAGPRFQAVVQDADHAVEQVALGGDVPVAGGLASVVMGAGAG